MNHSPMTSRRSQDDDDDDDDDGSNSAATTPAPTTPSSNRGKVISILYSSGDLGDVGRHAVAAALELPERIVPRIRVLTSDVSTLEQRNWKCGCGGGGHVLTPRDRRRLELIRTDCTVDDLSNYLEGVDVVISCLGNRQPFHQDRVAKEGTKRIVRAMQSQRVGRIVMLSSVGIGEDWPPLEWSAHAGNLLAGFFRTVCWTQYQDLNGAEEALRRQSEQSGLDFLIVRAVATGEQKIPEGCYYLQQRKYCDIVGIEVAKMDVARYVLKEAIEPSLTRQAITIGGNPMNQVAF